MNNRILFHLGFLSLLILVSCGKELNVMKQEFQTTTTTTTTTIAADPVPTLVSSKIKFEACIDSQLYITTKGDKLVLKTNTLNQYGAFPPGGSSYCDQNEINSYLTVDGTKTTIPITFWKKVVDRIVCLNYCGKPYARNEYYIHWEGEFLLNLNVLPSYDDSITGIVSNLGRGSLEITDKNNITVDDPDSGADWYDFDYTYEYYALR